MAEPAPDNAYAHPVAALFTIAFKVREVQTRGRCLQIRAT